MSWCLQGGNCLDRGFSRMIWISRIGVLELEILGINWTFSLDLDRQFFSQ